MAAILAVSTPVLAEPGCPGPGTETARVAATVDGRTLRLTDGREVLLAALAAPPATISDDPPVRSAGEAARAALDGLVRGREITLVPVGPNPDRWGRLVAHVHVKSTESAVPGTMTPLQAQLLARGWALLGTRVDPASCLPSLRLAERTARVASLGLWADPDYAVRTADRPADILRWRGAFGLVTGRVVSVRESGGTIYVNFDRRGPDGFAATIPKRIERTFSAAGLVPKSLAGRTIEVRGVIEARGGPRIEVLRPEQIAFAEER